MISAWPVGESLGRRVLAGVAAVVTPETLFVWRRNLIPGNMTAVSAADSSLLGVDFGRRFCSSK